MTQIHWTTATNGFFNDPTKWTPTQTPGGADTAILDAAGAAYTVTSRSGTLDLLLGGTQTVGALQTASNATLQVLGDIDALDLLTGNTTFDAKAGTSGGANAGKIVIQDAVLSITVLGINHLLGATATFEFGGTMNNTGIIAINAQPHLLGLIDSDQRSILKVLGATTLTGGGQVTMSNQNLNVITGSPTSSLDNINNTIKGSGFITGAHLTNEAAGVINANGSAGLVLAAGGSLINDGLIEATGKGVLIATHTIDNTGGGVIESNGGTVDLQGVHIIGGHVTQLGGTGSIHTNAKGSVLDGTTQAVTLTGVIHVSPGTDLTLDGAIVNTGKILSGATLIHPNLTDLIVGADGATLSGGGRIAMSPFVENRIYGVSTTATLTNVDNLITGGGLLGNGVMTLVNEAGGKIAGNTTVGLTIDTGANVITNAGQIASSNHTGTVLVKSAIDNNGLLFAATGNLTVDGAVTGTGRAAINGATLDFASTFNQNVSFNTKGGVLELADSVAYTTGVINGFSLTGATSLDLGDIGFTSGVTKATYVQGVGGGVLTVTDGTHTAHIHLAGNYSASTFTTSSDGHGGTTVVDPSSHPAAQQTFVAAMASFSPKAPASAASAAVHTLHQAMLSVPHGRIA